MSNPKHSIQIPFCGFYESAADRMLQDAIEQTFDYSDGGGYYNIPDAVHWKTDWSEAQEALVLAYLEAWQEQFESDTGIQLNGEYDGISSPKYYNFETDRIFIKVAPGVVSTLFTISEADNHEHLEKVLRDRHTSYDGFWSSYSNDLGQWLSKPVLTWDHNELLSLLLAVFAIKDCNEDDYGTFTLLEDWCCNGGPDSAVWGCLSPELQAFAEAQREHGQAMSYECWEATGKAYPEGTELEDIEAGAGATEPLPEPRCKETIDMRL